MGARGPVPSRGVPKLGHPTRAAGVDPVQKVYVGDAGVIVPEAFDHWHPTALAWYASLQQSGQSTFFEPSDWAAAQLTAEMITQYFEADKPNGQLAGTIWRAMGDLLTTESSRRRAHMEIVRGQDPEAPAGVTALNSYLSGAA